MCEHGLWLTPMWLFLLAMACAPKTVSPPAAVSGEVRTPEAVTGFPAELVVRGSLRARVSTEAADLVVHYGAEHQGSMETCGCPKRPRGSLPRLASYTSASREAHPDTPHLLLHGGYFMADDMGMDGELRADNPLRNKWMLAGLKQAGFNAINVSYHDLPGMEKLETLPSSLVSANVKAIGSSPAPTRSMVFEQNGIRVGVTGITRAGMGFVATPQYEVSDPTTQAIEVLQALSETADILILLVYEARDAVEAIATAVPQLDIVIDTRMHREFNPPIQVGDAVLTYAHYQTQRIGELRLAVDGDRVRVLIDRKIDLDPEVPDDPKLMEVLLSARTEVEQVQEELFGGP